MVNRTRVEGGSYSKHDIVTSVEVVVLCLLVVYLVRFYTSIAFLIQQL